MTSQLRNDRRRDNPRFPIRSNHHHEWIPRGGSSSSSSTVVNPLSSSFDSNPNHSSTLSENRRRENSFVRRSKFITQPRREGEAQEDGNLPQLVQEIQDRLVKGTVECMICCDMVRRTAPIWSCESCYSIFHLGCIKKWARTPTSIDFSAEKNNQGLNWRCPGCQSVQTLSKEEFRYVCFCGKRPDPPSDPYLTPHSCGESCGKPLEIANHSNDDFRCPHVCVLQCHPGPCPPCKAFAPPRMCPCGKKTITRRCSDRNSVPTCGQLCDKLLKCGRHRCERLCHTGPCDSCRIPINASCFCKKKMEVVLCGELSLEGEMKVNDGAFSCNLACGKKLGCGNHVCEENCHPGPCGVCELTPWMIRTCYCGKTKLQEERQSCLDPIPTCPQLCGKPLHCGIHHCKEVCHGGSCAPCLVLVNQKCRCGSSSRTVECYRTMEEDDKFFCEKPCGRKKSCGRHRCSERCCPLSNSNNLLSGDCNPHLCSIACGKKLRCGQHYCESFCHTGHCPPCLETIFTDLTCACGKTSIPPPLPCGTPPPSCEHPCSAPQPCGHSSSHSCHFGDCPSCSVPVAKECIGEHVVLRNIPCGSRDIRCNQLCGKPRQCGMHACARTCHPPPCDSSCGSGSGSKVSCRQLCGAPRRDCRHTCTATCHPSAVCPDIRCNFPVTITCSCGRITAIVPCDAGGSMDGLHVDTIFEASIIQKLPVPLQNVEANGKKVPIGQRKLVCDDECAKMERKRVLADAFDITPPNLDSLHFGENSVPDLLAHLFRREPKWVLSVEERFKFLVLGKHKGGTGNGFRVHVFCPMLKEKRDAVRQIAERWKLSVQESGWEPKQFLVVHVTPKSKAPARVFGAKGAVPLNVSNPPAFDPLVDMDPRLVVALLDLPRDANISALVLRFGGECELVWLNDKNALAVFSDPSRAASALRRLDHGSPYHGAVVVIQNVGGSAASSAVNAWGGGVAKEGGTVPALKGNPWKTAVVEEVGWREDSWGGEDCSGGVTDMQASVWKRKEAPIAITSNRWNVLDPDALSSSTTATVGIEYPEHLVNQMERSFISELEASGLNSEGLAEGGTNEVEPSEVVNEVVNDWEEAYE